MLSNFLKKCVLIIVLLIGTSLGTIRPFPQFLCLQPPFKTITKLSNNSYVMTDYMGRYWNFIKEDTEVANVSELNYEKSFMIQNVFKNTPFHTFDTTFRTDFDSDCELEAEVFYGLELKEKSTQHFIFYKNGKWQGDGRVDEVQLIHSNKHPLLWTALGFLNANKKIKAVLNFHKNGYLFIQDQNLIYVYCDHSGKIKKWQTVTQNVTKDVIIFENDYKLNFGDIIGGYVDKTEKNGNIKDEGFLYLFGGQITSTDSYVRKYVHKCRISVENSDKPSKIHLFCEKLYFKSVCQIKEVKNEEKEKPTNFARFGLIGAGIVLAILVIILLVITGLRLKQRRVKPKKDRPELVEPQKRTLAANRERVIGEKPKTLARDRTKEFELKT